jgi:hypothetical protein
MRVKAIEDQARQLMVLRQNRIRGRQLMLLSRLNLELGRAATPQNWNHIQGKIHPSFRATYDCWGGTLS